MSDPTLARNLAIVAVVLGAFAVVLGGVALFLAARRQQAVIAAYDGRNSARLRAELGDLRAGLSQALRHVAVVRYTGLGSRGAPTSWSVALLDDAGDGVVLTTINDTEGGRSYAKNVRRGNGDVHLSPEEFEAVGYAMGAIVRS
jgi:hypothetical protein